MNHDIASVLAHLHKSVPQQVVGQRPAPSIFRLLRSGGIERIRLPPRSPNLNAFAKRLVRSIKAECLNRMIFFSEASLRHAIKEYAAHYHAVGGILNYYYREAA